MGEGPVGFDGVGIFQPYGTLYGYERYLADDISQR